MLLCCTKLVCLFSGNDYDSVGPKFFEGMINARYFRKVSDKVDSVIRDLEDIKNAQANQDEKRDNNQKVLELMKAVKVWLSEPDLIGNNLYVPSLPPRFLTVKLSSIIGQTKVRHCRIIVQQ